MTTRIFSRTSQIQPGTSKELVASDGISFVPVAAGSFHFKTVQSTFKKLISHIYGDQKAALAKIKEGKDRTCEIMLNYHNPLGIVVYKNFLQNEYGLSNALELKTLLLLNPQKNSGHGYGSRLFQRIDEVAKELGADMVYCTASSKVEDSIKCAMKNGYKIAKILERNEDQILYLLIREL